MSYSFSGPTVAGLFPAVAGAALVGVVYQALALTNSSPIYLLVIREVADFALYQFVSTYVEVPRSQAMLYAATNLAVNLGTLALFRQKELIGMAGTAVLIFLMGVELLCKTLDFGKYSSSPELT